MSVFESSVRSLISKAEIAVDQGRIDTGLHLVHDFVERIVTEPLCAAQVFASHDLDQLCLRIGRHNLASLPALESNASSESDGRPTVVYVVSRLQRSGGHSRLVLDFIREQPEKNHLILSTEVAGPSDKEFSSQLSAIDANARLERTPAKSFQARLEWLQLALLSYQPEHVYLFNHHQDSVAVAALVPELGLIGSFCHHGDHHLCLGVHLNHLTHIDLHPMGYHYCRNELGIDNCYLPLTFEDKQCPAIQTDFMQGGTLTTATAARFNKIEIPYYVSYLETIPRVLKVTGGQHVHIGKLTPWALRHIYSQMRKHGIQRDRFIYIEWTPSVWKALQENRVDAYIASFPYGAGLTLIEAMGAGIPVIMHQHMYSRVLSGLELAYPEAFRWSDPEILLAHLANVLPETIEHEKKLARVQYEKFHRPEILQAYLRNPKSKQLPVPALVNDFKPRLDEWAAWAERQLNFSRLLTRFAYRTLRKLRVLLSKIVGLFNR